MPDAMPDELASDEAPDSPDTTTADPFYITGGTLPLDAGSYVVRRADTQLFRGLMRGEFCYVLNTRQMGKSSLMVRAARRLREEGCRVALLDLTGIGQNLTVDQWYYGLLTRTAAQTRTTAPMLAFWRANRELGPMQRFLEAIRSVLLEPDSADQSERLVIFVDEIDVVRSLPFSVDEFFAGIRECYNRRPQDPVFERLAFCLLGVAAPTDLVQDTRISPFNIGTRIELGDFTPGEAATLAQGLTPNRTGSNNMLPARIAERLLGRVLYWTNGHPYMTQRLCRAVAQTERTPQAAALLAVRQRVDHACQILFLTKRALEADDNLSFVRNRMLHSEADTAALLDLYRAVRRKRNGIDNDAANPLCSLLQLSGVAAASHERLVSRNRVYSRVFDDAWIDEHLPGAELRRQRAAFRRGVWRTAVAGGGVSLGFLALAGVAYQARVQAVTAEAASRARLSHAYVEQGMRLMDSGDASGALDPLTEAMRLDSDDPVRMARHRLRLGEALALCPTLDHLWSAEKPLKSAAFSPDMSQIAATGEDGRVYLWNATSPVDAATAELPDELPTTAAPDGQRSPGNFVAFSPGGDRLVTCHDDGCARVWDVRRRTLLYTLAQEAQKDGNRRVLKASWSGDSRHLVLIGGAHYEVWEIPTGESLPGSETAPNAPQPQRIKSDYWHGAIFTEAVYDPAADQFALGASNNTGWQIRALTPGLDPDQKLTTKDIGRCYAAYHVAYSRDGSRLLVAGGFFTPDIGSTAGLGVCVLDAHISGREVPLSHTPLVRTRESPYAAFSPDEKRIATADSDGVARIWDAATSQPLTPIMRHPAGISEIEFSPDGARVVTACLDGTARVWDATTGEAVCAPLHHAGAVVNARFGKDRDHILTASRDGTVRLWSLPPMTSTKGTLFDAVRQFHGWTAPFRDFTQAFHMTNERNTAGQHTNRAEIIDLNTGKTLYPTSPKQPRFIDDWIDATSGAQHIFFGPYSPGGEGGKKARADFFVWDANMRQFLLPVQRTEIAVLGYHQNLLMTANWSGTDRGIHLIRLDSGHQGQHLLDLPNVFLPALPILGEFSKHYFPFTPDESAFVGTDSAEPSPRIRLYNTRTGAPLTPPITLNAPPKEWAFSPNGRYLFTWSENEITGGIVQMWNTSDGTSAAIDSPLTKGFGDTLWLGYWKDESGLRFSRDGSLAITRSESDIYFWHLNGAKHLQPQRISLPQTRCVVFSPDGSRFAVVGQSQWLWNTRTPQATPLPISRESGLKLRFADFSPDSRRVIAIYEDGTSAIYDTQIGRPVAPPLPFPNAMNTCFSPDGTLIATGSEDSEVRVWDAATGEPVTPLWKLRHEGPGPPHWRIMALNFTPDQTHLVAGTLHLWVKGDTGIWNLNPTSLSTEKIGALGTLLSGQQMNPQIGAVLASPEATRAAWKTWQNSGSEMHAGR